MIVKSEWSPTGFEFIDDRVDRPDKTAAEWEADRKAEELTEDEVIALIGIRPDDAVGYKFPDGAKKLGQWSLWRGRRERMVWEKTLVLKWRDGLAPLASAMKWR